MNTQIDDIKTSQFYDQFWFRNVPHIKDTRDYMLDTIRGRNYKNALDAGCGHGVCSIILSEFSEKVNAVDISPKCIETATGQAKKYERGNITFYNQDLQLLDLKGEKFDLIWCWGVAMMAPKPLKVMDNLVSSLEVGGELYLGLYLKTWLSPVHEAVRKFSIKYMNTPSRKKVVLNFFAGLTNFVMFFKKEKINKRADNISIQTQVEDWYYPPYKTFYSIEFIIKYLQDKGLKAECIQDRVGRLKSATIFVIKAVK